MTESETGQVESVKSKVNFKDEEGGGGDRARRSVQQQQQEGVQEHVQEEDRAAVNHRVNTGSVSTSTRREGSSTICLQQ